MHSLTRWIAAAIGLCTGAALAQVPVPYKIVTASERGTYIQIGRDLAKFVAPRPASTWRCCRRPARPKTCSACAASRA